MASCPTDQLNAYADGALSGAECAAVAEHLSRCVECSRELEALCAVSAALDRLYGRDREVVGRVCARVRGARKRRRVHSAVVAAAAAAALAAVAAALFAPSGERESAIALVAGGRRSGECVTTGEGETAELRLKTGSRVELGADSRLTVRPPSERGPAAEVTLERGRIRVTAPKGTAERPAFRVSTSVGRVETIGTEFEVALAYEDGKGGYTMDGRTLKGVAKLALLVTVFSGQVLVSYATGEEKVVVPEGLAGLRGLVAASLVSKTETSLVIKVEKVLRLWPHNEAKNPEGAVGKELTLAIVEHGEWSKKVLEILKGLSVGDKVEVGVVPAEGGGFRVAELLRKASSLPVEVRGLRGILVGTISSKTDKGLVLKVEKVEKLWERNAAPDAEKAVGKELPLAIPEKAERLLETLKGLAVGDRVRLGALHHQGDVASPDTLSLVELLEKVQ